MFHQLQIEISTAAFWLAVGKIIWIDVLLSGDNALVIAMACRGLEGPKRIWSITLGANAAVVTRILFAGAVATFMELPYLKLAGGCALIFIAAKLLLPESEDTGHIKTATKLWSAVRIIVVADVVMSLDNVIAVSAAANGSVELLIFGLAISIPLIVVGATIITAVLSRLPWLVWCGAALLGWIAGEVIVADPEIAVMLTPPFDWAPLFGALGASFVLIVGTAWRSALTNEGKIHA